MGVETAVVAGLASAALSAKQQSDQASAMGDATAAQNSAIGVAANQTRSNQMAQLDYSESVARDNISQQNTSALGALAASSAARGISGSRLAATLETNQTAKAGLQLEDLAVNTFLEERQIDVNYANALNGRQSYQAPSQGLMLLGAGLQGLQSGLSVYGASQSFGSSSASTSNPYTYNTSGFVGPPAPIPYR